ncbi:MAG: hypothetical protein ACO2OZ_01025, partial [Acidilobaceae archaeon]
SRTRGYLKSFGVSVTLYEEKMLKLIEQAEPGRREEALLEAIRLNLELARKTISMVTHIEELQVELSRSLLEKLGLESRISH